MTLKRASKWAICKQNPSRNGWDISNDNFVAHKKAVHLKRIKKQLSNIVTDSWYQLSSQYGRLIPIYWIHSYSFLRWTAFLCASKLSLLLSQPILDGFCFRMDNLPFLLYIILFIWPILAGQNCWPYIRNALYYSPIETRYSSSVGWRQADCKAQEYKSESVKWRKNRPWGICLTSERKLVSMWQVVLLLQLVILGNDAISLYDPNVRTLIACFYFYQFMPKKERGAGYFSNFTHNFYSGGFCRRADGW